MNSQPPIYFIALLPHLAVLERIKLLKEEMHKRFQAKHALKAPAHITLQMPFRMPESQEQQFCDKLRDFAIDQQAFNISLSGFDCFVPRVIFVKIVNHQPIIKLHQAMLPLIIKNLDLKPKVLTTRVHPHMTIATRDLSTTAFQQAWPEFALRPFEAQFSAHQLTLLKHNGREWDVFREFPFQKINSESN